MKSRPRCRVSENTAAIWRFGLIHFSRSKIRTKEAENKEKLKPRDESGARNHSEFPCGFAYRANGLLAITAFLDLGICVCKTNLIAFLSMSGGGGGSGDSGGVETCKRKNRSRFCVGGRAHVPGFFVL